MLAIQLKRFSYSPTNGFVSQDKIQDLVHYPVHGLDLGDLVCAEGGQSAWIYDLFATVNHSGTQDGGHYVGVVKNDIDGQWYLFNDAVVSPVPLTDVVSRDAYLLFYQLRL